MAQNNSGIGIVGVIIGAVIVVAIGFFLIGGMPGTSPTTVDVNVDAPKPAPSAPAPSAPAPSAPAPSAPAPAAPSAPAK